METTAQLWLKQLSQKYQRNLIALLALRTLGVISQIACFWYFSHVMGKFIVEHSLSTNEYFSQFVIAAFSWVLTKHLADINEVKLQHHVEKHIQRDIEQRLNTEQQALCRQYSSYFWQHVWITHIPAIGQYVTQYQLQKRLSALIPVFIVVAIIPINYFVALILFITLPIVPFFMILVGKGAARLQQQHFVALERLGGLFIDRLKALTLLTSLNQHDRESSRLNDASNLVNKRTMRVVSVAFLSNSVLDFYSTVAIALIAVFIGFSLLGELSIGPELTFTYGLYLLLITPLLFAELKSLGKHYHQKAHAESAAQVLIPILKSERLLTTKDTFTPVNWLNFNMLSPPLHAPQLKLTLGEHILLQGDSGAGKTVFLEALMGLKQSSHQLSGKCVLLSQYAVITPDSVRNNLILDHSITDEKLLNILNQVELTTWLDGLADGLNTPMGEHPPLSGGEAQRLALARVLLQNADVVLLDEPTAHLTQDQHQQLAQLIKELFKTKCIIWASHKLLPTHWFSQKWVIKSGIISCK